MGKWTRWGLWLFVIIPNGISFIMAVGIMAISLFGGQV